MNVLAQEHNAGTPVRLETTTPRSRVKHSTTEPLRFLVNERPKGKKNLNQLMRLRYLTLKATITTAADVKFCDIFPNFQQRYGMIFHEQAGLNFVDRFPPFQDNM